VQESARNKDAQLFPELREIFRPNSDRNLTSTESESNLLRHFEHANIAPIMPEID